jgi:hypothetical protein
LGPLRFAAIRNTRRPIIVARGRRWAPNRRLIVVFVFVARVTPRRRWCFAKALALMLPIAPAWRFTIVVARAWLTIFVTRAWPMAVVWLAIIVASPPALVVLFDGLDDRVEPFTDRQSRTARGLARRGTRFRTETSEIPRTARFHSHVQATSEEQALPRVRADAHEQTTRRARFSVLKN